MEDTNKGDNKKNNITIHCNHFFSLYYTDAATKIIINIKENKNPPNHKLISKIYPTNINMVDHIDENIFADHYDIVKFYDHKNGATEKESNVLSSRFFAIGLYTTKAEK